MTDLEIARSVTHKHIFEVAQTLGIHSEDLIPFGRYKAKMTAQFGSEAQRLDRLGDTCWSRPSIRLLLGRGKRPPQLD